MKYNPTEKQLVQFSCPYFYKKKLLLRQDSNPGLLGEKPTPYQMTYGGLVENCDIFGLFTLKIVNRKYILSRAVGSYHNLSGQ